MEQGTVDDIGEIEPSNRVMCLVHLDGVCCSSMQMLAWCRSQDRHLSGADIEAGGIIDVFAVL